MPQIDPATLLDVLAELREHYPDDDDFDAAVERLTAEIGEEGDDQ